MKNNIREFDNTDQLENVICNRARLLLKDRKQPICTNALRGMTLRAQRGQITTREGKLLVDDDFIAMIAREIKDDTLFFDGAYTVHR